MTPTTQIPLAAACLVVLLGGSQLIPTVAHADDEPSDGDLHNITYRARVDGLARNPQITFKGQDNRLQIAEPPKLPGRTFEANTVLPMTDEARIQVSIDPPYTVNLHCQILVDGDVVAQADEFIGPRFKQPPDDPNYGVLTCQAPVNPTADAPPPGPPAPNGAQPVSNQPAG